MNFSKFYTWMSVGAVSMVLTLGGYIWSNHTSAEASALEQIRVTDERQDEQLRVLREISIKLEAYIEHQKELNEWFTTEHLNGNRRANP